MIQFSRREDNTCDRRIARSPSRMQLRSHLNLLAQVGGSSQKKPGVVIGAYSNLCLGTRLARKLPSAQLAAIGASAIPLRETSPGCRAEDLHLHGRGLLRARVGIDLTAQ